MISNTAKTFHHLLGAAAIAIALASAIPAAQAYQLVPVGGFNSPVDVREAPGYPGRLFVVEQPGRIMVVKDGATLAVPLLDIRDLVGDVGEEGLLSVAFPPDYKASRRFYVWYVNNGSNLVLAEFKRSKSDANRAVRNSRRTVLTVKHPGASNHNGGQLHFDGLGRLYVSVGDGGHPSLPGIENGEPARDLNKLLGKILRIDPRKEGSKAYTVPKSNPYVGKPGRNEIFAYGLRNPWRFSLEAGSAIIVADVGEGTQEEVTAITRPDANGGNYGWPEWEGTSHHRPSSAMPNPIVPIFTYANAGDNCAITGGYLINDPDLPALAGRYIYGDFCAGDLRTVALDIPGQQATGDASLALTVGNLFSFGRGLDGQIYVLGDGSVYRLEP